MQPLLSFSRTSGGILPPGLALGELHTISLFFAKNGRK